MSPVVPVRTEQCADLGMHEAVGSTGRQCTGGTTTAPCPCWCHHRARTDRRLLERTADERCGADPASVLELTGHLRSTGDLHEGTVERLVTLVLDLGWRRVLGYTIDPARRVPDPLLVSAATVRALLSDDHHQRDGAQETLAEALAASEGRRPRPIVAEPPC